MFALPDYTKIKRRMVAEKYRREIELSREMGISNCTNTDTVLELFAGTGGLTKIYRGRFNEVITSDINKMSIAEYKLPALTFINTVLPSTKRKIDMVDFDCYGCPTETIKRFFEVRKNRDAPFVLTLSDGLGLWMKMTRKLDRIRERYLLTEDFKFDERHPWREHPRIITEFLTNLGRQYSMNVRVLFVTQLKFKNYTVGSWKFY